MTLTVGGGPFGQHPTGRFDFDPPAQVTFVEVHPRRVRGISGGATVVDSAWSRVDWISRYLGSSADSGGVAETTDR